MKSLLSVPQIFWFVIVALILGGGLSFVNLYLEFDHHSWLELSARFGIILLVVLSAYQFGFKPYQIAQNRLAEELIQLHHYTSSILDSMTDGLLIVNQQGTILNVNQAASRLTGFEEEELPGLDVSRFFMVQEVDGSFHWEPEKIVNMLQQEENMTQDFLLETRFGVMIPVQVSTSWLQSSHGKAMDKILLINDITERREVEISVLRYQTHLQEMVEQRTEKLKRAMEAANAANQAKNEFLANMSHEIRSPMTAIIGMTDLVLHSPVTTDQREKLNIVQNASNNLLTLINGILDLSKIEAGQLFLEKISFDLIATVENISELIAIKAHEKDLELFCYIPPDTPKRVIGDPNRLTQILMNLLANAIKFTHQGEVTVLVQRVDHHQSTHPNETEEQKVVLIFSIADTGIGISKDCQEQIFERFTQADGSTTRKYGGTGLGLTISKLLTELMGGSIRVESEINEGSVFHVTIPFGVVSHQTPMMDMDKVSEPEPENRPALVGVRILIVDANPTGRSIAAEILQAFGAIVGEAENPVSLQIALEKARDQHRLWDVILLDYRFIVNFSVKLLESNNYPGCCDKVAVLLPVTVSLADLPVAQAFPNMIVIRKPLKRLPLLRSINALLGGTVLDAQEYGDYSFDDAQTTPLRILMAEDMEENRQLAATILEKAGHQVVQAKDGQEALDRIIGGTHFDLLLTDLHMPIMDGYELTRQIRLSSEEYAHIPIVAVTARALPGEKALCFASGFDEFLVKPYGPMELLNVTKRATLSRRVKQTKAVVNASQPILQPVEDEVLFQEAMLLYFQNIESWLELLKKALDEKNLKSAKEQIEAIKKVSLPLGAQTLKMKAIRLGTAIRAEEWLKANKLYKELLLSSNQVQDHLTQNGSPKPSDSIETL